MARSYPKWARRPFQPQKAARESIPNRERESEEKQRRADNAIRAVLVSAYIFDPVGAVWLRRLDPGPDRGAQLNRDFQPIRSSLGGRCSHSHDQSEWAQFWAQS